MLKIKKIKFPHPSFPGKWKETIKKITERKREKAQANMQSDEMMSLSEKLKLHRDKVHLRTVLLAAAAVLLVGGAFVYSRVRVLHRYSVLSSVERSDDAATSYVRLDNRTLKCNPNGVTCVNDSNEVQWNVTFTLQNPIVDVCGSTVVVGDQRGQDVYVFNKEGQIGHFEVEYTLTKVRVAAQGVVAAVLEDGDITYVNVYDSSGTLLVKSKTTMNENGYPLDIDISADGQKLAVSYLTMDNKDVKTNIVFYNFSAVGQSAADYQVNSVEYEAAVAPAVHFLSGSYAVACRDDGLTFSAADRFLNRGRRLLWNRKLSVFSTAMIMSALLRRMRMRRIKTNIKCRFTVRMGADAARVILIWITPTWLRRREKSSSMERMILKFTAPAEEKKHLWNMKSRFPA